MQYQSTGSTDGDFSFGVKAFDAGLNEISGDHLLNEIKNSISIWWPNASDSLNNHLVTYDPNNRMFKVTVFVNQIGRYTIKSKFFDGDSQFDIGLGKPSTDSSYAYAYNQADD